MNFSFKYITGALFFLALVFSFSFTTYASQADTFTSEELEFISNSEPIIIGQMKDRIPFSFVNENTGQIDGIFVALCELISEKTGLTFEYKTLDQGERPINFLEKKKGTLVAGVSYSSIAIPSPLLNTSNTLYSSETIVLVNQGETFDPMGENIIAITNKYIGGVNYISNTYPNSKLIFYNEKVSCLDALLNHEATVSFINILTAHYLMQAPRFNSLEILPVYQTEEIFKIVELSDSDTILMSIINKAIDSISMKELDDIIIHYALPNTYQITWRDLYYQYKTPIILVILLFITLVFVLVFSSILYKKNVNLILKNNEILRKTTEAANQMNHSKSRFLAQLSQEIRTPMYKITELTGIAIEHLNNAEEISYEMEIIDKNSKVLVNVIDNLLDIAIIESGSLELNNLPFHLEEFLSSIKTMFFHQSKEKEVSFILDNSSFSIHTLIGDRPRLLQLLTNIILDTMKHTEKGGSIHLSIFETSITASDLHLHFVISSSNYNFTKKTMETLFTENDLEKALPILFSENQDMGLFITKYLINFMGGNIKFENSEKNNIVFTIEIPFTLP